MQDLQKQFKFGNVCTNFLNKTSGQILDKKSNELQSETKVVCCYISFCPVLIKFQCSTPSLHHPWAYPVSLSLAESLAAEIGERGAFPTGATVLPQASAMLNN